MHGLSSRYHSANNARTGGLSRSKPRISLNCPMLPPMHSNGQFFCMPVAVPSPTTRRASKLVIARVVEGAGADGIVFGKPQASRDVYEGIAQQARAGLMQEVTSSTGDVVMATLHIAAEDDAIKTRTHIPLPVEAFSERLDVLAAEVVGMMPRNLSASEQLTYIMRHLYNTWGLRVAKTMEDGLYSPYRVYMHQVLAQRCGTQAACAAVLHSLLSRLHANGSVAWHAQVGIPMEPGAQPTATLEDMFNRAGQASKSYDSGQASRSYDSGHASRSFDSEGMRWVTGRGLVAEQLDQLKRAYWSWNWPVGAASGFDACARGLLGEQGRAGRVSAAVGVMQAQGRPYGNVELAMLASERLCLVTGLMGQNQWAHQTQVRDYATQLLHVGKSQQGLDLLEKYVAWLEVDPTRAGAVEPSLFGTLRALVQFEKQRRLEGTPTSSVSDIIDPERDA